MCESRFVQKGNVHRHGARVSDLVSYVWEDALYLLRINGFPAKERGHVVRAPLLDRIKQTLDDRVAKCNLFVEVHSQDVWGWRTSILLQLRVARFETVPATTGTVLQVNARACLGVRIRVLT